jgi:hypothetical protein
MLNGGFEQLGFAVCGNHDRAVHLARILSAIDVFAFHGNLLSFTGEPDPVRPEIRKGELFLYSQKFEEVRGHLSNPGRMAHI